MQHEGICISAQLCDDERTRDITGQGCVTRLMGREYRCSSAHGGAGIAVHGEYCCRMTTAWAAIREPLAVGTLRITRRRRDWFGGSLFRRASARHWWGLRKIAHTPITVRGNDPVDCSANVAMAFSEEALRPDDIPIVH